MGNKKSKPEKRGQNNNADEVVQDKETESVQEIIEIYEYCEGEGDDGKNNCTSEDHEMYIPVKDFSLDRLPEDIRDKHIYDYISHSEKLVVRLNVVKNRQEEKENATDQQKKENTTDQQKKENTTDQQKKVNATDQQKKEDITNQLKKGDFADKEEGELKNKEDTVVQHKKGDTSEHQEKETERRRLTGTGFVWVSEEGKRRTYKNCPLKNCTHNNGESHSAYGGLIVYTNHHVIQNNEEALSCQVDFFYLEKKKTVARTTDLSGFESVVNSMPVKSDEVHGESNSVKPAIDCDDKSGLISTTSTDADFSQKVEDFDFGDGNKADVNDPEICGSDNLNRSSSDVSSGAQTNYVQTCASQNEASPVLDKVEYTPETEEAYGYYLRENKENKDLVGLKIIFHNPELFHHVNKYWTLRLKSWSSIPGPLKSKLKEHAIVISHPHGDPKRISCGKLLSLEEENADDSQSRKKITKYNATTCNGSSGAPVLTGHYHDRPFTHSSKWKLGLYEKVNVSYSY